LSRLGFGCSLAGDTLVAKVPSFRLDVTIPEDLIEELLRMGEYERPTEVGRIEANATSRANPESLADQARFLLAAQGLSEIVSWAFVPKAILHVIAGEGADPALAHGILVKNPISADYEAMRTSLLPGLVAALKRNVSRGVPNPCLFEVGPVIHRSAEAGKDPVQANHAAGVLVGDRAGWLKPGEPVDFYDAKRVVAELLQGLGVSHPTYALDAKVPFLHPGISARIAADKPLGVLGQVHPRIAKQLDLTVPAFYFELWIDALEARVQGVRSVAPPRFPAITRDISFWIDSEVPAEDQRAALADSEEALLVSIDVLEDFRDPRYVPPGKKGMLWTLTYRSSDRTLTDGEVDQAHARVLAALSSRLTIQIR
jgi:phenylalanyl-tRNA synthetase beta chain